MRKIAATALALPIVAIILLSSITRRAGFWKAGVMVGAVGLLVAGLLFGLPAKDVSGQPLPTFAPLAPQGDVNPANTDLALDAPFQVTFTKPMNENSVEANLTISPKLNVKFLWDVTGQILSLTPDPHWDPFTGYHVTIATGATDQEGLALAAPIDSSFQSGSTTTGKITASSGTDAQISPASTFQITFTRPVKLSTVLLRFGVTPPVPVTIVGDDPTDAASQVFTMTPKEQLAAETSYLVSFADGGTDSSGSPLTPVTALHVQTMAGPDVVRFRPQDGSVSYDTHQPVSVRFTVAMDPKSTGAALVVTVNGKAISGSLFWSEGNTVLLLSPKYAIPIGATVVATVGTSAKSADGLHLGKAATATFKTAKPVSSGISYGGGALPNSPWYASEVYYFKLMNCTRTGGWVTRSGACSTQTNHTLPAQSALALDAGISAKVSRPYAKYMADRRLLDHYLIHDPHWRLCNWGGYCGGSWGENIASPSTSGQAGMIDIEIFYQNEYWCRCEHYWNIMAPFLHRAGVGVWVSASVRVSIDFYG